MWAGRAASGPVAGLPDVGTINLTALALRCPIPADAVANVSSRRRCSRRCVQRRSVVRISRQRAEGLADRITHLLALGNLAHSLCAWLNVPPPCQWLLSKHNHGKPLPCSMDWSRYVNLSFRENPEDVFPGVPSGWQPPARMLRIGLAPGAAPRSGLASIAAPRPAAETKSSRAAASGWSSARGNIQSSLQRLVGRRLSELRPRNGSKRALSESRRAGHPRHATTGHPRHAPVRHAPAGRVPAAERVLQEYAHALLAAEAGTPFEWTISHPLDEWVSAFAKSVQPHRVNSNRAGRRCVGWPPQVSQRFAQHSCDFIRGEHGHAAPAQRLCDAALASARLRKRGYGALHIRRFLSEAHSCNDTTPAGVRQAAERLFPNRSEPLVIYSNGNAEYLKNLQAALAPWRVVLIDLLLPSLMAQAESGDNFLLFAAERAIAASAARAYQLGYAKPCGRVVKGWGGTWHP